MQKKPKELPVIGWREWVGLPDLGIPKVKAKVDSGARSSALHALSIKQFTRDEEDWVEFEVHPLHRKTTEIVQVQAKVLDFRSVRSSSG